MKKYFVLLSVLLVLACFSGCCAHSWVEGNCTTPKTCTECGATEGDVVHNWGNANCNENKVCLTCGETGGFVEHEWIEANCTNAAVCNKCGEKGEAPLGHTTKIGVCGRCGEDVDLLKYNDGFAIVTIGDCEWMKDLDDFVDVCVTGTIESISKTNVVVIVDSENGRWSVDVGTDRDLTAYINTECLVFGFSSGGISSQYYTPLINMDHENNKIEFYDSKSLYPENFESWQQFDTKYSDSENQGGNGLVWIPTDGGTKYHSKSTCSGMDSPEQVTEKEAIDQGFSKCGKCW